jgi:hypothetical protein
MAAREQLCSTEGCGRPAAFRTTSNPTWCVDCLNDILAGLGLEPAVPFPGRNEYWRTTRCLTCGAECDYRLEYLLELRSRREPSCRRCFWAARAPHIAYPRGPGSRERLIGLLEDNGFEAVEEITPLASLENALITRCKRCGRQEAKRPGDIGWGCSCRRNGKSASTPSPSKGKQKDLLCESEKEALKWWDHDANDEADFNTLTVRARRVCQWGYAPNADTNSPPQFSR